MFVAVTQPRQCGREPLSRHDVNRFCMREIVYVVQNQQTINMGPNPKSFKVVHIFRQSKHIRLQQRIRRTSDKRRSIRDGCNGVQDMLRAGELCQESADYRRVVSKARASK